MTSEGKLWGGKFGLKSGRMIEGQVVEWTGSGSVELPIAGDWQQ